MAIGGSRWVARSSPYNGFSLDHAIGTKIGGSTFDSTGRRHSAADLLRYAGAPNIRVAVYASVERILLASSAAYTGSRQSAIGVLYRDQMGRYHHAIVREHGEVILDARCHRKPSAPAAKRHWPQAVSLFMGDSSSPSSSLCWASPL